MFAGEAVLSALGKIAAHKAAVASVSVVLASAVGIGALSTSGAAAASLHPQGSHAHHRRGKPASLARRADYALYEVRYRGGWRTISVSKGVVMGFNGATLTLHRRDGATITAAVTPLTHFRGAEKKSIAAGEKVIVVESGNTAIRVIAHPARSHHAHHGNRKQPMG